MENQTNTQTSTSNEIRKNTSQGELEVSRVYKGDFDRTGEHTAELKQSVTTKAYYPTKQIRNDKQDNIYGLKDFGATHQEKEYTNNERRVAWIKVPEGETVEKVAEKLKSFPNARLYRVLANKPILTSGQKAAIENPDMEVTKDDFANRQAVRHPETNALILDRNGKVQYRSIYFSATGAEDQDLRTADPSDAWMSADIIAELEGSEDGEHIIPEQTI